MEQKNHEQPPAPKKDQLPGSSKSLLTQELNKDAEQEKKKRSSGCGCGKKYGSV